VSSPWVPASLRSFTEIMPPGQRIFSLVTSVVAEPYIFPQAAAFSVSGGGVAAGVDDAEERNR